ncbi:class I SAM-dependent methyltransferase [Radicibacter daui]|uniref:class I SAM-dependent methyltransferase n=1 Tax=Radicibacter daui TaxID=3064829 RepID=UPI004046FD83
MLWLSLALLAAPLLLAILATLAATVWTGVPSQSSSPGAVAAAVEIVPEEFDGTIIDAGAGWGALTFSLAIRFPECPVIAVELSPLPWLFLQLQQRLIYRLPNVQIIFGDFNRLSFHGADLVACYLTPPAMARLAPKLKAELQPGSLVVSNSFGLPGWRPIDTVKIPDDTDGNLVALYCR